MGFFIIFYLPSYFEINYTQRELEFWSNTHSLVHHVNVNHKGRKKWKSTSSFIWDKRVQLKQRGKLYHTAIIPTILYGNKKAIICCRNKHIRYKSNREKVQEAAERR